MISKDNFKTAIKVLIAITHVLTSIVIFVKYGWLPAILFLGLGSALTSLGVVGVIGAVIAAMLAVLKVYEWFLKWKG